LYRFPNPDNIVSHDLSEILLAIFHVIDLVYTPCESNPILTYGSQVIGVIGRWRTCPSGVLRACQRALFAVRRARVGDTVSEK
jgi:hypothetical protein